MRYASRQRRRKDVVLDRPGPQRLPGTCASANSYYFDRNGDSPFRTGPTFEVRWRSTHFPIDDYRFSTVAAGAGATTSVGSGTNAD